MTSSEPPVQRAESADHLPATDSLAQAFGNDPAMSWMVGAGSDTAKRLSHLFGHMLATELAHGEHLVDVTDGARSVALWHDVDQWKTSPSATVKMVPAAIRTFGRRLPVALRALSMIEKVHPDEPHRHLAFIGVNPAHQGQGLGGALLASMTAECDTRGLGAYLESSNPRNDALYARYGFESRGPIALPKGAPTITAMWRTPR